MPEEEMPQVVLRAKNLRAEYRQGTGGQEREPPRPSRAQRCSSAEHEHDRKRRRERQPSHPPDAGPPVHQNRSSCKRIGRMTGRHEKNPGQQSRDRHRSRACAALSARDAEMERNPCGENEDQDEQGALAEIRGVANLPGQIRSRSQRVRPDRHAQQGKACPEEGTPFHAVEPPDRLQVPGQRSYDLLTPHRPTPRSSFATSCSPGVR